MSISRSLLNNENKNKFLRKQVKRFRLLFETWKQLARRIDPSNARVGWRLRGAYYVSGACYSQLKRLQHESHIDQLKTEAIAPPIFLMGFWRSGTTFLHELFCCDQRFGFPSTYACLNPSHFLLTERVLQAGSSQKQVRRPMDDMQYSWMSPQEDEFALLALGAPSPYEALLVPSLMRDPGWLVDLRLRSTEEEHRWGEAIQYFVRLLSVQQHKPMVLKSPPHGFRLHLLPTLFPQSRYVVIERNPFEVFASNLKLWQTLLNSYSLESFSVDDIESFVLTAYSLHEAAIIEHSKNLEPRTFARVRYEDLVSNPIGQIERLYFELNLGDFEVVRPRIMQHLSTVANHKRNSFQLSQAQRQRVQDAWGEIIDKKGYAWPEGRVAIAR